MYKIKVIANGDLVWQASAFNFEFEAMDETIFQGSLNIAKQLDKQFNISRKQYVLSNRDVPGKQYIFFMIYFDCNF